jgi:hypothetical protein
MSIVFISLFAAFEKERKYVSRNMRNAGDKNAYADICFSQARVLSTLMEEYPKDSDAYKLLNDEQSGVLFEEKYPGKPRPKV